MAQPFINDQISMAEPFIEHTMKHTCVCFAIGLLGRRFWCVKAVRASETMQWRIALSSACFTIALARLIVHDSYNKTSDRRLIANAGEVGAPKFRARETDRHARMAKIKSIMCKFRV